jgi:hypothetical protein
MSNALIIFIYSFCIYGFANMVVYKDGPFHIFDKIKELFYRIRPHMAEMLECMICLPSNLGWICSLIDWFFIKSVAITPFNILLAGTNLWWLALIGDICFASGIVWFIHNVESFFESIAEGTSHTLTDDGTEEDDNNDAINVHN